MFNLTAAGIISKILGSLKVGGTKAKDLGITKDAVTAVSTYLTNNKQLEQEIVNEIDRARQHDIQTSQNVSKYVINIRGLIRPLCTVTAFIWYIYAKLNNIELTTEDYSIIGGILAFWFGFRSYEKKNKIF